MISATEIRDAFLHLLFPHVCPGCGGDLPSREMLLCLRCHHDLPETHFESIPDNPVEKLFWGRLPIFSASARYYFTKGSLVQRLMHLFKYKGEKDLGLLLGKLMGMAIMDSARFPVDALVPLPLFPKREKQRGYNQAAILCQGLSHTMRVPILDNVVCRPLYTETQTRKGRIERWKNIEGKFVVTNAAAIKNRHLMLVDDVITTGATLESCGNELLKTEGVQLSIATLSISSH